MKPTELKLEKFDDSMIRKIYMHRLDETWTVGGPDMWFDVIMRFLEYKGYEIKKVDDAQSK